MNGNENNGGYNWQNWKSQKFEEPSWLMDLINRFDAGVSTSEYRGAHSEIDRLIENADPGDKIARLATMSQGRNIKDLYRVLNPDSTVRVESANVDRYYGLPGMPNPNVATYSLIEELLRKNPKGQGMDKQDAAYYLAAARNNPYNP